MKILSHWIVSAVAIGIAAYIVPDVSVTWLSALIAAVVLGAFNYFLRPLLLVLTLPINVVTLGLFSIVINAVLVMLAAFVVPNFVVNGFWSAVLFALVLSLVNWVFSKWQND